MLKYWVLEEKNKNNFLKRIIETFLVFLIFYSQIESFEGCAGGKIGRGKRGGANKKGKL